MPNSRDFRFLAEGVERVDWIHKSTSVPLKPPRCKNNKHDRIVLATISRNLSAAKGDPNRELFDCPDKDEQGWKLYGRLQTFDFIARRREILRAVEDVARFRDRKAKGAAAIIGLGELDYPIAITADREVLPGEIEFRSQLQNFATSRECLVVAGTYHDPIKHFNKAVLFAPEGQAAKEHAKLRPAHKIGEAIRTPDNSELRYYDTKIGKVAILVCMDVFDLNIMFSMAKSTFAKIDEGGEVDYIIVPSYNKTAGDQAAAACQRLSYFTCSTVIYVNCTRAMPYNAIYVCGKEITGTKRTEAGIFLWESVGSRDSERRITIIDRGYIDECAIDTLAKFSPLAKSLVLGQIEATLR